jgi:hypothetical protein
MSASNYKFKYQINGTDVGAERHLLQWVDLNHYYHTPHGYYSYSNVAVIPFCLDTTSYQPTGTLNFSRIDAFQIVSPDNVPLTTMSASQYMYATNYNMLELKNGISSLLYWD